jgi:hypothetical protein
LLVTSIRTHSYRDESGFDPSQIKVSVVDEQSPTSSDDRLASASAKFIAGSMCPAEWPPGDDDARGQLAWHHDVSLIKIPRFA